MAMMRGTRQAAVRRWLLLSAVCSLCAVPGTASAAAADKKQIVISRADSVPGRSFAIVGRVMEKTLTPSLTESNQRFEERSGQRLVGKARELGADAVLGMHGLPMDPDTHPQWVSGIAVRFVEPGASAPSKRAPFIVAVLPIEIPDSLVKSAKQRSLLADGLRDGARDKLETRGYYAATDQSAAPDSTQLAAMTDSTWDATFGAWTERVLCIRPGASRASSMLIQEKRQTAVAAWMYSRSAGRVVWRGEAVGSANNWKARDPSQTLFGVFETDEVVVEKSLVNAVSRVLENIPAAGE